MWFKQFKNLQQVILLISFIISSLAIIFLQHDRHHKLTSQIQNNNYFNQESESLAAINLRKIIPTFGFDNLVADSIYLDFVQYFGDKPARKATGYSLVPDYFEAISQHDPQFTDAYLILATANSMYAGKAEKTVNLMNEIVQQNSLSNSNTHLIWQLKATDELLFLGDIDAAKNSYTQAANSALQVNSKNTKQAAMEHQNKVQFLATNPDTTEAQIRAWQSVLPNIVKEAEKQEIRDRIKALKAKDIN